MSYAFIMIRSPGGEQGGTKAKPEKNALAICRSTPLTCGCLHVLKEKASR
jgi:hypothetical protein